MSNELSKNLMCVCMRNGVQKWIEKDRVVILEQILVSSKESKFIDFDGEILNTADIVGVFSAPAMEELTRRKNGQWKCKKNSWHDRGQKCECEDARIVFLREKIKEAIANCGKCTDGYIVSGTVVRYCDCCAKMKQELLMEN